ncbi:hypothetical protein Fmac_015645 [Flemingia macrophylla]|uniref:Uncharacterized protein n=1 Tax=Flemingia macrophylla TaxID=520843 RepID=A0ABD1MF82_9FABA
MIGMMNGEPHVGSFWIEEIDGKVQTPMRRKRKYRAKKKEYQGWASTSLICFLESIGRDATNKIAQSEVANIILEYVKQNGLFHKTKKKRIECDKRLHTLFGRKSISRLKINDLLELHFAENCDGSSDDILFDLEEDEDALAMCETPRTVPSERRTQPRKPVFEKPRSCFAAIVPANIKLVYLKRSLVEDLLKDPETFESKVVGSFIRIRCDPNDYLQKNSHQLLQVTGMKKSSEVNGEIHLQASGFIKDIRIPMLSDDNFSEEECEDLCQRVKDGLVKKPVIVDMEQTARVLHEDMTKHWLARELTLLQNLIDRANEKGWRRDTLDEYLRRREKLQSRDEQERLFCEFPQVISDDQESESTTPDVQDKRVENNSLDFWQAICTKTSLVTEVPKEVANTKLDTANLVKQQINSPKSIPSLSREPEVPLLDMTKNSTMLNCIPHDTAENHPNGLSVQQLPKRQTDFAYKNGMSRSSESHEVRISHALPNKQIWLSQHEVIEVNDILPPVQQLPEEQTDLAYKNGVFKLAESHELEISPALPNKHIQPSQPEVIEINDGLLVQQLPEQQIGFAYKNDMSKPGETHEAKISQALPNKQIQPSEIQVIELSDDEEENEKPSTTKPAPAVELGALMWHYRDPKGNVQGPFSLSSLKRWRDAGYFSEDFMVWKSGHRQDEGVLLMNVLDQFFAI